jgi:hypothetical protein
MAIIQFLVQSHLLPVVAHRPVGMETAAVRVVAALMEAPMVALAQEAKVTMAVMVAKIAVVAVVALVLLARLPLVHTLAVMAVRGQHLTGQLALAVAAVEAQIKGQAVAPVAAVATAQILPLHIAEQQIQAAVAAVTEAV